MNPEAPAILKKRIETLDKLVKEQAEMIEIMRQDIVLAFHRIELLKSAIPHVSFTFKEGWDNPDA